MMTGTQIHEAVNSGHSVPSLWLQITDMELGNRIKTHNTVLSPEKIRNSLYLFMSVLVTD